MRTSRIALIAAVVLVFAAFGSNAVWAAAPKSSQAEAVIRAAAQKGRYVFVTFYKRNSAASTKMLADVKKIQSKLSRRASFTTVDVGNSAHRALVQRYGVNRSPIPLTIVLAPNGAVTAGFPTAIKKTDFSAVFVSKGKAEVLKTLQYQKLAVVCLQNTKTKHNKESLEAARGLVSEMGFSGASRIVQIDPKNRAEAGFLREFKVNTGSREAQIVIIAPPGTVLGRFSGAVSTDRIVASLNQTLGINSSSGSCGPVG